MSSRGPLAQTPKHLEMQAGTDVYLGKQIFLKKISVIHLELVSNKATTENLPKNQKSVTEP